MDNVSNTLLRPSLELSNHVYFLGYCWSEECGSCWGVYAPVIYSCQCRTLRRGKHRLLLWPGHEADGSVETRTPSKVDMKDEMGRLEKVRAVPVASKVRLSRPIVAGHMEIPHLQYGALSTQMLCAKILSKINIDVWSEVTEVVLTTES